MSGERDTSSDATIGVYHREVSEAVADGDVSVQTRLVRSLSVGVSALDAIAGSYLETGQNISTIVYSTDETLVGSAVPSTEVPDEPTVHEEVPAQFDESATAVTVPAVVDGR